MEEDGSDNAESCDASGTWGAGRRVYLFTLKQSKLFLDSSDEAALGTKLEMAPSSRLGIMDASLVTPSEVGNKRLVCCIKQKIPDYLMSSQPQEIMASKAVPSVPSVEVSVGIKQGEQTYLSITRFKVWRWNGPLSLKITSWAPHPPHRSPQAPAKLNIRLHTLPFHIPILYPCTRFTSCTFG